MNKLCYCIIVGLILFSCNQKKEHNIQINDVSGVWEGEHFYDGESGDTIVELLLIGEYWEGEYDNKYVSDGKYTLSNDTMYFKYYPSADSFSKKQTIWFKYKNASTLVSQFGVEFNKIHNDKYEYKKQIYNKVKEEEERFNREYKDSIQKADTLKPTMYEVVQMLTGRTFIGKKNNYYFTFDFTYNVLDEDDNAMFMCRYEEFELNTNYGTTPMEILKQSANQATFLKAEKLMVKVMKNDLKNNMIVVKRIRAYDDMPRFDFWITEIERDSEGNLEDARIDAQALGVRLNGIRK